MTIKLTNEEALAFFSDTNFDPMFSRYMHWVGEKVKFRRSGLKTDWHDGTIVGYRQTITGPMLMIEPEDATMDTSFVRPANVDGLMQV